MAPTDLTTGAWRTYTTADGLPALPVEPIIEDDRQRLWFATTTGGVTCFDGHTGLGPLPLPPPVCPADPVPEAAPGAIVSSRPRTGPPARAEAPAAASCRGLPPIATGMHIATPRHVVGFPAGEEPFFVDVLVHGGT